MDKGEGTDFLEATGSWWLLEEGEPVLFRGVALIVCLVNGSPGIDIWEDITKHSVLDFYF